MIWAIIIIIIVIIVILSVITAQLFCSVLYSNLKCKDLFQSFIVNYHISSLCHFWGRFRMTTPLSSLGRGHLSLKLMRTHIYIYVINPSSLSDWTNNCVFYSGWLQIHFHRCFNLNLSPLNDIRQMAASSVLIKTDFRDERTVDLAFTIKSESRKNNCCIVSGILWSFPIYSIAKGRNVIFSRHRKQNRMLRELTAYSQCRKILFCCGALMLSLSDIL